MASDTRHAPGEADREAAQSWGDTGPHEADRSQTSVPEAPAKKQARTRVLGPRSIAGTLCADPEMRFVGQGKALVKIRVAEQQRHQDKETGQWLSGPAQFWDVSVWGRQGENVMEALRKGDRVVVNGILQETTWIGDDLLAHTTETIMARDIGPSLMFRQARVVRNQEGS